MNCDTIRDDPKDRVRKKIDLEISCLYESIRVLKSRRNALSPISKLPSEILIAIFKLLLQDCLFHPDSAEILHIAHVCEYWREVATTSTQLWTYFDLSRKFPHPAVVSWSKQTPIVIWLIRGDVSKHSMRFISKNVHRIRVMWLRGDSRVSVLRCFDRPAPVLEGLELSQLYDHAQVATSSLSFFGNPSYTPALRRLNISFVVANWNWPMFSHITHLELLSKRRIHPELGSTAPSAILEGLKGMPQLQSLLIIDSLPECPSDYDGHIPSLSMVDLPALRLLKVESLWSNCLFFMHHLRLSPSARIYISAHHDPRIELLPPLCTNACSDLQIMFTKKTIVIKRSLLLLSLEDLCENVSYLSCVLRSLRQESGVERLQLRMEDSFCMNETSWRFFLGKFTEVSHLEINLPGRNFLLIVTGECPSDDGSVFLPLLKKLIVWVGVGTIRKRLYGFGNFEYQVSHSVEGDRFHDLFEFLTRRRASGYGVPDVRIVSDKWNITDDEEKMFDGLACMDSAKDYPAWRLDFEDGFPIMLSSWRYT